MKRPATRTKLLHFTQSADRVEARAPSKNFAAGVVTGLLLVLFLGGIGWQSLATPNGAGLAKALGMIFLVLLFFGFIPVVMLRRQRITLNAAGLESRFFLFGVPIWRNFVATADLTRIDSVWDGGSDEGACMRLLLRTRQGEIQWGIDADNDEIVELGKRLNQDFQRFRRAAKKAGHVPEAEDDE